MWRMGRSPTRLSPRPHDGPCLHFFFVSSNLSMFSIGCADFLVAVLFDVAVAAGKVTSTKAVLLSPASNVAKPEFRRSAPP
jgi:hypothetical protein